MLIYNPFTEHVLSIISSMLRHCHGTQRQRLMSKFTENDHEKVDRLLELHFKYLDKVEIVDKEVENIEKVQNFINKYVIIYQINFSFTKMAY